MTIIMTTNKRFENRQTDDYFWKGRWMRYGNAKQNLHHNSTKRKEGYKRQRETLQEEYAIELEYQLWGVVYGPKDLYNEAA